MKNFKLLLGATALLSTRALMANAYLPEDVEASTEMTVKAEIIKDLNLKVEKHLDFGRIAWDYDSADGSPDINVIPDSDGSFVPSYNGVKFHDGGQVGKICFADLIPTATLDDRLSILRSGPVELKDKGNNIGNIDMGNMPADAGALDGIRCFYIGGQLLFYDNEYAKNFSGKIEAPITITVMYDAVE